MDRAERRFRAQRIAEFRFQMYLDANKGWFNRKMARGEPITLVPVGAYRKRTTWGCQHCTKHRKGSPHYGWGACFNYQGVRPTILERHRVRKIILEWIQG